MREQGFWTYLWYVDPFPFQPHGTVLKGLYDIGYIMSKTASEVNNFFGYFLIPSQIYLVTVPQTPSALA